MNCYGHTVRMTTPLGANMSYTSPRVSSLGSVLELTQVTAKRNKIGGTPDTLSAIDASTVGSFVSIK